jgi:hypothetical protein
VTPEDLLDEPDAFSPTGRRADIYDTPAPQIMQRGQHFFQDVYGKVARRVMGQMDRSGTEDLGLVARLMYGYVLSNTAVLSAAETSFVMIAGLIPQDVNPQLKGHLSGRTEWRCHGRAGEGRAQCRRRDLPGSWHGDA